MLIFLVVLLHIQKLIPRSPWKAPQTALINCIRKYKLLDSFIFLCRYRTFANFNNRHPGCVFCHHCGWRAGIHCVQVSWLRNVQPWWRQVPFEMKYCWYKFLFIPWLLVIRHRVIVERNECPFISSTLVIIDWINGLSSVRSQSLSKPMQWLVVNLITGNHF